MEQNFCIICDIAGYSNIVSLLGFSHSLFVFCPGISIQASVHIDPVTGLSNTSSILEYSAEKEDTDAQFTCSTQPISDAKLVSSPVSFTITCKSTTKPC